MTIQDLISALQKMSNKRQNVAVLVMGHSVDDTLVTSVHPQVVLKTDDPETIGVCWLEIPRESSLHS